MKLEITTVDFPGLHTDFKLLQSRALRVPFHSLEIRKTMSKYRQIGIKANEAPTYPLLRGNECT